MFETCCRRAVNLTQHLPAAELIATLDAQVLVEAPRQDIYEFTGRFSFFGDSNSSNSSSNNKSGRKAEGGDVATAPVTAASTEAQPDAGGTLRQQQQCQPSIRPLSSSAAPSATTAAGIAGAGPGDAVVGRSRSLPTSRCYACSVGASQLQLCLLLLLLWLLACY